MTIAAFTRRHGAALVPAALAATALACSDGRASSTSSRAGITGPDLTLAAGFNSVVVARGNLGTFHVQSKADGYDVELKSHDNTDIVVASVSIAPGGSSGWHKHPGPVMVVVKSGTVTFYNGDDPTCAAHPHPAGTSFIESGGDVGMARNEGTDPASVVATYFVPAGSPPRIDAPSPGNCAF
jgi:hypothetical protein